LIIDFDLTNLRCNALFSGSLALKTPARRLTAKYTKQNISPNW